MTFRSILCPVDFSPQSRTALKYAIAIAGRFAADVTVLFVNDPLLLAAADPLYRARRGFVERTSDELARFVKHAGRGGDTGPARVSSLASAGNPAEEILRQAKRLGSDLVVMGSHGLSGLPKVFFGSTTEQVLRRATVPVLAIPPSIRSRTELTIKRVIAPIDLSGEWHPDAVRAADIAAEFDAPLLLVHVLPPVQMPPWFASARRANDARRIEKARRALERVRSRVFADLPSLSTLVVVGDPARQIAALTKRDDSLLVMSLRGTAGVWGMRRGAVAYHVLAHSLTPVLALPRRRIGGRFPARARKALHGILTARDRAEIAGIDALLSAAAPPRRLRR